MFGFFRAGVIRHRSRYGYYGVRCVLTPSVRVLTAMDAAHEARVRSHRHAAALNKAIGTSIAFRRAIDTVVVAAKSDATVLICGETGTGKELVARSVQYLSERADQPFVAVNCGSLTDRLLEDEIFGH